MLYLDMKKSDEKLHSLYIRIPETFWIEISEYALHKGMTVTEFAKRAFRDYMVKDRGAPQVSREELKELIKEVLEERKEE